MSSATVTSRRFQAPRWFDTSPEEYYERNVESYVNTEVFMRVINDDEIIAAIQSAPKLFERKLKKEFGKLSRELRKDTLKELSKHQDSKWILEDAIVSKVRGSMESGFISVRLGISSNVNVPGFMKPNMYGYLIEAGNQRYLVGSGYFSDARSRYSGRFREPRPFLEPAREKFIDSGIGEDAIDRAIAETVKQFNEGA
jgi:hypothetical protein